MLNTSSDKTVVTKDKKGNPTQFSISVSIIMTLKDDFGNENTTIFLKVALMQIVMISLI